MFLGMHRPRLDEKGRLALPVRFRDELPEGVVITKGQDRCLWGFTTAEFQRIGELLRAAPMADKTVRDYQRMFFGSAISDLPDRQGRVNLPSHLREYAGLDRDCVVLGLSNRFEVWDAGRYAAWHAGYEDEFVSRAKEVVPGVI